MFYLEPLECNEVVFHTYNATERCRVSSCLLKPGTSQNNLHGRFSQIDGHGAEHREHGEHSAAPDCNQT